MTRESGGGNDGFVLSISGHLKWLLQLVNTGLSLYCYKRHSNRQDFDFFRFFQIPQSIYWDGNSMRPICVLNC